MEFQVSFFVIHSEMMFQVLIFVFGVYRVMVKDQVFGVNLSEIMILLSDIQDFVFFFFFVNQSEKVFFSVNQLNQCEHFHLIY